ncbi:MULTISPECIES: non-ribosomal peptide synthetase [Gammaproteobacteria]|uniref:non-ribosomal peptide synthetase n=1 Tax=Gammaproteobacteria TaxID=1236 RepID=UPI0019149511|nr:MULTISPECIES: non-ribosomal peptide synthetase [Gammaproteobacteria]MBK5304160.1 amino acid adenylation domain-containing protein [Bacillus sp. TH86]MBK5323929.1 amino acid adenylation domain-containing protein [Bacillus sp. TH59]MBK5338879.1 amino acid adenylation domain-containing protein [Bacillus sp. TH57]MBK5312930.1 amino acid adenylation domain-containing protein [Pseudomonas sp. TH71]MBK5318427.1 amino acid adenylation domain-containing protein [Erwinia sp. TH79]
MENLLESLFHLGVELRSQSEELNIRCEQEGVLNQWLPKIRQYKKSIINFIPDGHWVGLDFWEERKKSGIATVSPVTFAQRRLWLMHEMMGADSAPYNETSIFLCRESLDIPRFNQALNDVITRHSALRTRFEQDVTELNAVVGTGEQYTVELVDLRFVPGRKRPSLRGLVQELAKRPFDLNVAPLFRVKLFRLKDSAYLLCFVFHHIITDRWSGNLIASDLVTAYLHRCRGEKDSPLPSLPFSFIDYAYEDAQGGDQAHLKVCTDYWSATLADSPATLSLPLDRARPPVQTYQGARHRFALKPETVDRLATLGAQHGCSRYMSLLAIFALFLSKYASQNDVVIGTPVSGRSKKEYESLVGLMVNTVALRIEQHDNDSFYQYLEKVREVCLGAFAHQDLPFDAVVDAVQPARSKSYSPLYQVMFTHQVNNRSSGTESGFFEMLDFDAQLAKFDLTLSIDEMPGAAVCFFEYNTDLFDASTIARFAEHFNNLLLDATQHPENRCSSLRLEDLNASLGQLADWNMTGRAYPQGTLVHQLFEQQVERTPDQVAVASKGQQYTYAELNARANQLARYLRAQSVGPDSLVAVFVDRSVDMMVAILGILKAGAAYCPVDPGYPLERIEYMLEDAAPKVVLTQEKHRADLPTCLPPVLALDTQWAFVDPYARDNLADVSSLTTPEHLAYVIYTSGSTGKPKGAGVHHQGVVNLLSWYANDFALDNNDRFLIVTSFSFDLTQKNLFASLLCGGRLYLSEEPFDPDVILEEVESLKVTTLNLTPSAFYALAEADSPAGQLSSLRRVFLGGEPINMSRLLFLRERYPELELINSYGPTECSDVVAFYRLNSDWSRYCNTLLPIGQPIANTQLYILNSQGQSVPIGVSGEIFVGGVGVARGYLNRPELNEERFVPDPFLGLAGSRLYKTGDQGFRRADGTLIYLGRDDHQVKIRGFRIELGEIEAQLDSFPHVKTSVVIAREDHQGDKRLVAYITAKEGETVEIEPLRTSIKSTLPDYMRPSAYVLLEDMPLTPSGKLDRLALPVPEFSHLQVTAYAPPVGTLEIALAEVWQDILGIEKIGRHDDFFELGGHSLLAMQMNGRIRQKLKHEARLKDVFEYATIERLATRLRAVTQSSEQSMVAICREDPLPLSFSQQRMWVLNQFDGLGSTYSIPAAVLMKGPVRSEVFSAVFDTLVERHETLRSVFPCVDDTPVQVIKQVVKGSLKHIDLSSVPVVARERERQRLLSSEAAAPFDLERGPLIRASLVRLDVDEHLLLVTMHHIVSDGWSMGVLINEVASLYQAYVQGKPSPLPELPVQYVDFAHWQRQWLAGGVLADQLAYWTQRLAGAPVLLTLPTDRPRPAMQSYRGDSLTFSVPAAVSGGLAALGKKAHGTLFMVLTAAFNLLLSRYSGQSDICLGTAVANRTRIETEALIGFFTNTLVLRTQVDEAVTFESLLDEVRQTTLDAYAHQDVPFEQLVETLKPVRHTSHSPLFQVMLVLQNAPLGSLQLPGLILEPMEMQSTTAKFDLLLVMEERAGELHASLEYNTDLFDRSTVQRMAQHFTRLLESVVEAPNCPLHELTMIDEAELARVTLDWNDTQVDYPAMATLQQMVEMQVARTPQAPALVFEGQVLTYAQLNGRANRLAGYLRERGVGPDVRVGVCLERSLEMVITLLGIVKAGGAYLPLDPGFPTQRLAYMLEDAAPALVLTQAASAACLPEHYPHTWIIEESELAGYSLDNPVTDTGAQHLAYVIYTSGSTGRPKGVAVEHAGIVNRLQWMQEAYRLEATDRVLQKTPFSFDVSVWEFFWPLAYGATLVVAKPGGHQDVDYLARLIAHEAITTLHFVPPMLEVFLTTADMADCRSLKQVMCSGQALPLELQQRFFEGLPDAALHNLYGPTEASVDVTFWACDPEYTQGCVPIGRPIANTRIYLLDQQMNPVPAGVAGELYIGGIGLARGYLGRADLTAAAFVPDPFGPAGARLYKTGDLARYRSAGEIEYLGRLDHQVKIHGLRIELGEIESRLARYPGIREAVVLAQEDRPGEGRLVAYYTLVSGDEAIALGDLREHLGSALPSYMVPHSYLLLAALPLSANGKLDRRALPMVASGEEAHRAYEAPVGEVEEQLAALWEEMLHVAPVGRHDNFFDLGGHSLLATQLVSRIRRSLAVELPLRNLFEMPTIKSLATCIIQEQQSSTGALPTVTSITRKEPLQLSFAQQRLWFIDQLSAGDSTYNMTVALQLSGELDLTILASIFNEIIRRHEVLRTTFTTSDGQPSLRIAASQTLELIITDLAVDPHVDKNHSIQQELQRETQTGFDLSSGPLMRVRLLRLGTNQFVAVITMHHIVSDGWSMGVLINEVASLYQAYVQGKPSPLPELPVQYVDFAHWQRQWLAGGVLADQLAYWTQRLAGAPVLLTLPTDRPRPAMQSYRGDSLTFSVPAAVSGGLAALGKKAHGTLFMVLTAAFNLLLSRYSGQSDICLGTAVANRTRIETEALIGFFTNTLVLRTQVDEAVTFESLLDEVRQTTLDAYAHQDVPFEQLVETLKPVRHTSHSPLFQVMLVLQNAPLGSLQLPGLILEPMEMQSTTAKFDLLLVMEERAGELHASLEYNTDLFDRSTVQRMAQHFTRLLESVVEAPNCPLHELTMIDEAELARVTLDWNDTQVDYPAMATLQQMVEMQVARTPQAPALVFEGQVLTYAQLNGRANRLAGYLRERGVGPDVRVGVCLERSLEMVITLLGIVKAGGAYLPLDPGFPTQRLAYMLEDAAPALVLTQAASAACLPEHYPHTWIIEESELAGYSLDNPVTDTGAQHLAYVIYTSGSTGRPKGVAVEHAGIVNRLQWMQEAYRLEATDRVLQKTPFSFDVSVWEFFWPLAYGATLVVAKPGGHQDVDYLARLIAHEAITTLHFVPPMLEVFLTTADMADCRSLKQVMCSGQALPLELQQRFFEGLPDAALHNLYGPTEASVDVTFWACDPEYTQGCVPIGRPIANTRIYLLDQQMNPVPAGVAGELYIGGIGLARGYLGRADLTAAAFVPDPFGPAGARLYKTGDLARYRSAGEIEYLGRLDHQVKIHGLRIELGEIESRLARYPGIREAVVLAQEDRPGEGRLVAYYTLVSGDEAIALGDLREHLGSALPSYMVPHSYLLLAALPLSANGKLDRRALPMVASGEEAHRAYEAPVGEVEEQLAALWEEMLHVAPVGRHDNFFDLGGHSLLVVQMISRIRKTFEVELPIAEVFKLPVLSALSDVIYQSYLQQFDASELERIAAEFDGLSEAELQLMLVESDYDFESLQGQTLLGESQ